MLEIEQPWSHFKTRPTDFLGHSWVLSNFDPCILRLPQFDPQPSSQLVHIRPTKIISIPPARHALLRPASWTSGLGPMSRWMQHDLAMITTGCATPSSNPNMSPLLHPCSPDCNFVSHSNTNDCWTLANTLRLSARTSLLAGSASLKMCKWVAWCLKHP